MPTKRQKGKRRDKHNRFQNKVRSALADVEARRRLQRKKGTDAFVVAQMAKHHNLEPRAGGGWQLIEWEEV